MDRKPIFWIAFTVLAAAGVYYSVAYFSLAFPIVSLDLRIDRDTALARAREIADVSQFGPDGYRQVATFSGDQEVQHFVELEAGGTESLHRMISEGLYHPYQWTVRHFKEGETRETRIRFTPAGEPYGFTIKLPEDEPGIAIDQERALEIARATAATEWGADLEPYHLAEKSSEVRPGGRVDHVFVYERSEQKIGEGLYRLRLVVGGDRLTEFRHFVRVPEAFSRRYQEMRSANEAVGFAGAAGMTVFYIIGGGFFGLFYLMRKRWVIWRTPVFWGLIIGLLQLLADINQWPLLWLGYDTAVSARSFVAEQILYALIRFFLMSVLLAGSFMAAESLSRRAFPGHIQQWRLWSTEAAASPAVLGRTVAGYLLVSLFCAYEVFLYFFAKKGLGWWTPSDVLVQPDLLATYLPWLSSIAISAQAGFWEESLFRAVPIAGAALLGNRFGRRGWWIAGAMILQALIFGAGHAGYANQPFYARVVELIIPSLFFGALYIIYGLLPAVILHFVFDVVWIGLPLFVSTAPGIWVDRGILAAVTLLPLWVVLAARIRAGRWTRIPEELRNRAWQPAEPAPKTVHLEPVGTIHPLILRWHIAAGAAGLLLWVFLTDFKPAAPPLEVGRGDAEKAARLHLQALGVDLGGEWKTLSLPQALPGEDDRFIWRTAGKEKYGALLGEHLAGPHWKIRFARFEGDVAERAEEHQVLVNAAGAVSRYRHILPEARAGAALEEDAVRDIAVRTIASMFGREASQLQEVSVVPTRLKQRTDWKATFTDTAGVELPEGELRIAVVVSGDQVADAYRFVHVPEEWSRGERDRKAIPEMAGVVNVVLILLAAAGAIALAIVAWSRQRYSARAFVAMLAVLGITGLAGLANKYPELAAGFTTAQPFKVQVFVILGGGTLGILLVSAGVALIAGYMSALRRDGQQLSWRQSRQLGVSLGLLAAGLAAASSRLQPPMAPLWGNYGALGAYVPTLETVLDSVNSYLVLSVLGLALFAILARFARGWMRSIPVQLAVSLLAGLVLSGSRTIETMPSWLISGAIAGMFIFLAFTLVFRYSPGVVVVALGMAQILALYREALLRPYPGTMGTFAFALIALGTALWIWSWHLLRPSRGQARVALK